MNFDEQFGKMVFMKNWANMKGGAKKKLIGLFDKIKGSKVGRVRFFEKTQVGFLRPPLSKRDSSKARARDVRIQRKVLAKLGVPTKKANSVIWLYRIRRIADITTRKDTATANAARVMLDFLKKNKAEYLIKTKFETLELKQKMADLYDRCVTQLEKNISDKYHLYRESIVNGTGTKEVLQEELEFEQESAQSVERLVVKRPNLGSQIVMGPKAAFMLTSSIADLKIRNILGQNQKTFEEEVAKAHEEYEEMRNKPSMN